MAREPAEHFWPCSRRRFDDPVYSLVEIGVGIDDDGVLAAHLGDCAFDMMLSRRRCRFPLISKPTLSEPVKAIRATSG